MLQAALLSIGFEVFAALCKCSRDCLRAIVKAAQVIENIIMMLPGRSEFGLTLVVGSEFCSSRWGNIYNAQFATRRDDVPTGWPGNEPISCRHQMCTAGRG